MNTTKDEEFFDAESLEVVIGVFSSAEKLNRVAESMGQPDLQYLRLSHDDPTAADEVPDIVEERIENITVTDVEKGVMTGGVIGLSAGLLAAIPAIGSGLALAAPLAGFFAGAWIGGVAGADEANRGVELPNIEDYQRMIDNGKSLLMIMGDERERMELAVAMKNEGAEETFQHPPVQQMVR